MPISNWKHLGDETVYLALTGQISAQEHRELARALADIAQVSTFRTVLMDKRDLDFEEDTEKARQSARDAAGVLLEAGVTRVCFIAPKDHAGIEPFKQSFEDRGGTVHVCPDFTSAVEALGLSYAGPSPRVTA